MENASKALLIAGAILIAILIIGIGMMVFNGIGSITDQQGAKVDAMAIQMFNANFEPYKGTNVSGANVKALLSSITANNTTYLNDTSRQIRVNYGTSSSTTPTGNYTTSADINANVTDKIGSNYRYTVTFGTDTGSGYINECNIKRNT